MLKNGILHLIWSSPITVRKDVLYQIFYGRSLDGGKTWKIPVRLAETSGHSLHPRIVSLSVGFGVVWYDLQQREIVRKRALDFGLIKRYLENPALNVIPVEKNKTSQSTIMMTRSFDNGESFSATPFVIHEIIGALRIFSAYQTPEEAVGICWNEENEVNFKETKDDGVTWEYNWKKRGTVSEETMPEQIVDPNGEVTRILTPIDPYLHFH